MAADAVRACTECGGPVEGRAKTCSAACRSTRSRRLRRERPPIEPPDSEAVGDAARELLQAELRPVIREAITAEVLDGIKNLVGHVPKAIDQAVADLDSLDDDVRGRAYTLILRYSIGNQAIVPDINDEKQRELTVNFNLPRPPVEGLLVSGGVIESKECDSCGEAKPLGEFVANSDRCQGCFDRMRASAAALVGTDAVQQT